MAVAVEIRWDTAGMTRLDRMLGTFEGRQLQKRVDAAMLKEVRTLVRPMRAQMGAMGVKRKTGNLSRSIKASKSRKRPGEASAVTVGPHAPHRHLIIRGHRIVTPGGRDTGRRSRAFPFVDPVIDRMAPEIIGRVGSDVWAMARRG